MVPGIIISWMKCTSCYVNMSLRKLSPVCNYWEGYFVLCALVVFCVSEARMSVWDLPPLTLAGGQMCMYRAPGSPPPLSL